MIHGHPARRPERRRGVRFAVLCCLVSAGMLAPRAALAASPAPLQAGRGAPGGRPSAAARGEGAAQDERALLAAERAEADLQRRRGRYRDALRLLEELVADDEADALSWAAIARVRRDLAEYDRAERNARRALELGREAHDAEARRAGVVELAETLVVVGRAREALSALEGEAEQFQPGEDPVAAWLFARAYAEAGDLEAARRIARAAAASEPPASDWRALLARGQCQRWVGLLEAASRSLVSADKASRQALGSAASEPEVLVALADLYFESEREVEAPGKRSAGALYREALAAHPTYEAGLLGQFELFRYNRRRVSKSPEEILAELLAVAPDSIAGRIAAATADLEDGRLVSVREQLQRLGQLAPERRAVRTLEAALAWVEHRRDDCEAILAALAETSPLDSAPERSVGKALIELYRFSEGVPFLQRAVERDPGDYEAWTQLGEALANTGREDEAREALALAKERARGRQDAFRNNLTLVLERMQREHVVEPFGELTFSWQPDAAEVLRTYLLPYYQAAREELAARYGFTPGPTRIEVFRRHQDFSVRSVGFEGFPALGVCFGPVVTAVSPLSEMRGSFSWARTGFHEFSHVVHLGLSNNRCPRWITEGLATWEEVRRNPTWTRNMRRDLVDAYANDDLILVRDLNRAFRGPRILFGYYQGGLLCEMLIDRHGFTPMVRLLQAFDLGADLDQAFRSVFDTTPEEVDAAFRAFVAERIAGLAVEPRWSDSKLRRLQLRLASEPPRDDAALEAWANDWATVAWGAWQAGRRVDADNALRRLERANAVPPRARFLEGEIALSDRDVERARELWQGAIDAGGTDYRALVGLGTILLRVRLDLDAAEAVLKRAAEVFPGYPDSELSAERLLIELYTRRKDEDAAMRAREAWLAWQPGEYAERLEVAAWHVAQGRDVDAVRLYADANEVDPFRRDLHVAWGRALQRLGRHEEALRELRVALVVPVELDLDHRVYTGPLEALPPGANPARLPQSLLATLPPEQIEYQRLTPREEAELHRERATSFDALGRVDEAQAARALADQVEAGAQR
ncbi:MAG: tetratricopeptide repeat protein [Planctomycetota bacterium]